MLSILKLARKSSGNVSAHRAGLFQDRGLRLSLCCSPRSHRLQALSRQRAVEQSLAQAAAATREAPVAPKQLLWPPTTLVTALATRSLEGVWALGMFSLPLLAKGKAPSAL